MRQIHSFKPPTDIFRAIQTFGTKWSEKDLRASILVGASLLKHLGVFCFLSGMNALNVKLVKGHRHECSSEAMPYSYYLTPSTLATCRPFQSKKHRLRALFFTSLREQSNPSQGPLPSSTRARSNQKSIG